LTGARQDALSSTEAGAKGQHSLFSNASFSMSSLKAKLKAAKELYVQHKYQEALQRCNSALQDNDESPDGLL
jgi:uncharacterized protein involved in exopolysaccharide biosynthesis